VKHQLAVVTADSDIVGVLQKMLRILTNDEYADMLDIIGNATATVEEYCQCFPMCRILEHTVFQGVQYIA
jgi:hypothetical protein